MALEDLELSKESLLTPFEQHNIPKKISSCISQVLEFIRMIVKKTGPKASLGILTNRGTRENPVWCILFTDKDKTYKGRFVWDPKKRDWIAVTQDSQCDPRYFKSAREELKQRSERHGFEIN